MASQIDKKYTVAKVLGWAPESDIWAGFGWFWLVLATLGWFWLLWAGLDWLGNLEMRNKKDLLRCGSTI